MLSKEKAYQEMVAAKKEVMKILFLKCFMMLCIIK